MLLYLVDKLRVFKHRQQNTLLPNTPSVMAIKNISTPFMVAPMPKSFPERVGTDLYNKYRQFSEPDTKLAIQTGTSSSTSTKKQSQDGSPVILVFVIAGNHDLILDPNFVANHPDSGLDRQGQRLSDLDWGDVHYLNHESVDLEIPQKKRSIRVFGSPWTVYCGNWAFQYGGGEKKESFTWTGAVPTGTDVLLVHGPPKSHLDDGGRGCEKLLAEIWRSKPSVMVFGHIHSGHGEEWLWYSRAQGWFENIVVERRRPWASLIGLALCVLLLMIFGALGLPRTASGSGHKKGTHLINAAMAGGRGNPKQKEATVAII
ncbi:hypothetical protein MKZ38_004190 [Zalerion maritima]|uniref:Calcineurin-like phosphoesterase domain-containing protein n=1 Tax=Zalerion maritima TaxID=339359 RepID=A0AAD5RMM7_9PEZI|nr:hypothetical protein MKZ38_004190 [Zalerion maritima]